MPSQTRRSNELIEIVCEREGLSARDPQRIDPPRLDQPRQRLESARERLGQFTQLDQLLLHVHRDTSASALASGMPAREACSVRTSHALCTHALRAPRRAYASPFEVVASPSGVASSASNAASSSVGTPSFWAFSSFVPASAPTTT